MKTYSDFVERVFLQEGILRQLMPREPLAPDWVRRIRDADDAALSGGSTIADPAAFALVRGGLFYAVDAMPQAHAIFQEAPGDLGAYWHGMMHRREGDFDNARYWFRRAGRLSFFDTLHSAACERSPLMARQSTWDPYLLTGQCEQARFGAEENLPEVLTLQRVEFDRVFDYCWRQGCK